MKTSKYYGVSKHVTTKSSKATIRFSEDFPWIAFVKGLINKRFETETQAAKAVDMALIRAGKEPRNILKRAAQ